MQETLAVTLASMQQDMQKMDRVALNMANATTIGYKREVAIARPFIDAMASVDPANVANATDTGISGNTGGAGVVQTFLDIRPGTMKMTGEPLDVALSGDGYFEISTDNGPAYTRQGTFRLDARGRLVTTQGYPVMGKGGEIFLTTQKPSIDSRGMVTEPDSASGLAKAGSNSPVAQLKVVKFDDEKSMRKLGSGLMEAGTGMTAMADSELNVRQGALENSNVSSLNEMTDMMQTVRHFESMQRMTQNYDDMLGTAIRKLGDMS